MAAHPLPRLPCSALGCPDRPHRRIHLFSPSSASPIWTLASQMRTSRKLWISRDERHEGEQAGGSAELDARRRRPMGDVRRVLQAPSDHERIRSHWPRTKGHGEMQEQKLRRRWTHGFHRMQEPVQSL
ncbi:uncharacterized protein LOC133898324 [Phragmites australis]|uniref:uncharacterized protein LOC133898324 n=1 Tax=Phragmites australis TaxID=29695 RepID=UPI002D7A38DF|nr:uncharacterized protein LOC133898324 [Phragmites australis]